MDKTLYFKELVNSKNEDRNGILAYVVFEEHTLGYLFKWFNVLGLVVLGCHVWKGGINWKNGPYMIGEYNFEHIRKATEKDFEEFRGDNWHLENMGKMYSRN